jgi:cysteine desulfuration protein SufE
MTDARPPTLSIADAQSELADEFLLFDDWMDRYQQLIDQGRKLDALPEAERTEELKVPGCQSQVWLKADYDGHRLHFRAASDAIITSGLISLLLQVYSGRTPREIVDSQFTLAGDIGLQTHLSPSRANGFANMVKRIREEAAVRL